MSVLLKLTVPREHRTDWSSMLLLTHLIRLLYEPNYGRPALFLLKQKVRSDSRGVLILKPSFDGIFTDHPLAHSLSRFGWTSRIWSYTKTWCVICATKNQETTSVTGVCRSPENGTDLPVWLVIQAWRADFISYTTTVNWRKNHRCAVYVFLFRVLRTLTRPHP